MERVPLHKQWTFNWLQIPYADFHKGPVSLKASPHACGVPVAGCTCDIYRSLTITSVHSCIAKYKYPNNFHDVH